MKPAEAPADPPAPKPATDGPQTFTAKTPVSGLLNRLRDTAPMATPLVPVAPPTPSPFAELVKPRPVETPPREETHAGPVEKPRLRPKAPKAPAPQVHGAARGTPWSPKYRPREKSLEDRILELAETPEGRVFLRKQFDAESARMNFSEFVRQAWHVIDPASLDWNWHHQLMCCVLQALFMDWLKAQREKQSGYVNKIRNVVFNVPPGSLKSKIIAVCFHAWVWLHWPGLKLICLSVNDDAAMRDARSARDLIRSPWYVNTFKPCVIGPGGTSRSWGMKGDQDAASNYGNTAGGDRLSLASKAEIVGLRGDILLIDDPNNPKKSENKKERDEVNDLWSTNQYNRVNDPLRSLRIGVQQRTNAGDWTGNVIALQGEWSLDNLDGWLHVVIPAEADMSRRFVMPEHLVALLREWMPEEQIIARDPRTVDGEVLDPKRQPLSYLESERKRWAGTGNYVGQMLQAPALVAGLVVQREWFGFCRLVGGIRDDVDELDTGRARPAFCHGPGGVPHEAYVIHGKHHAPGEWDLDWIVISVDCAAKKTTKGSNWGIGVVAGKGGRRFVLDDRTRRGALHEIIDVIVELIHLWRPDSILIEDKAAGPDVMDTLRERMGDGDIPMVTIESVEPGNDDKEMRLQACLHVFRNGMLYLLDGAPWLEEFVKEFSEFPNGLRDDRVDYISQVLNHKRPADDEWPD